MTSDKGAEHPPTDGVSHVDHADHVGTADHVDHISTLSIRTSEAPTAAHTKDLRTVVVLRWGLGVLMALAVLVSALTALFVLISRDAGLDAVNKTLAETKLQLSVVQSQLADAQAQLKRNDEVATVTKDCEDRLSRNITAMSQANLGALDDLVIAIGSNAFPINFSGIVTAKQNYANAVSMRDQWVAGGEQQPCPLLTG